MKVNFIIAGFQKCGTSALHNFLSHHPNISVSKPKEAHYFSYDYRYNKGIGYYHSFFKESDLLNNQTKFLEASPSYININCYEKSLHRIYTYNNNIKVIGLIRNPIERAYSAWIMFNKFFSKDRSWYISNQERLLGYTPKLIRRTNREIEDFNIYIENELAFYNSNVEFESPILYKGFYFDGVNHFKKKLGDNFFLIKNEDFLNNTSHYLTIITQFFGLEFYDWSEFDKKKFFSNNYESTINMKTKEKLLNFYFEDMSRMNVNFGINYLEQ